MIRTPKECCKIRSPTVFTMSRVDQAIFFSMEISSAKFSLRDQVVGAVQRENLHKKLQRVPYHDVSSLRAFITE